MQFFQFSTLDFGLGLEKSGYSKNKIFRWSQKSGQIYPISIGSPQILHLSFQDKSCLFAHILGIYWTLDQPGRQLDLQRVGFASL